MMLGRGVRGVWGSCLRFLRLGVLVLDVDSKGFLFIELLFYKEIE